MHTVYKLDLAAEITAAPTDNDNEAHTIHDEVRLCINTYKTNRNADKEDWGGDLEFAIRLTIQLTIEVAIDLSHGSTWNHMDQHRSTWISIK